MRGTLVYEWTEATSWRQIGYVKSHDEVYEVVRNRYGFYAFGKRRVRRLDEQRGKWNDVWTAHGGLSITNADCVSVGDDIYAVQPQENDDKREKTDIFRIRGDATQKVATVDGVSSGAAAVDDAIYIRFYTLHRYGTSTNYLDSTCS
jgi:hypothetical protein